MPIDETVKETARLGVNWMELIQNRNNCGFYEHGEEISGFIKGYIY
jgi:hypothetical protein